MIEFEIQEKAHTIDSDNPDFVAFEPIRARLG